MRLVGVREVEEEELRCDGVAMVCFEEVLCRCWLVG